MFPRARENSPFNFYSNLDIATEKLLDTANFPWHKEKAESFKVFKPGKYLIAQKAPLLGADETYI